MDSARTFGLCRESQFPKNDSFYWIFSVIKTEVWILINEVYIIKSIKTCNEFKKFPYQTVIQSRFLRF